jgi:hypothetical protein
LHRTLATNERVPGHLLRAGRDRGTNDGRRASRGIPGPAATVARAPVFASTCQKSGSGTAAPGILVVERSSHDAVAILLSNAAALGQRSHAGALDRLLASGAPGRQRRRPRPACSGHSAPVASKRAGLPLRREREEVVPLVVEIYSDGRSRLNSYAANASRSSSADLLTVKLTLTDEILFDLEG